MLIGMLGSTIPISILGSRFAMSNQPFWSPINYSKHLNLGSIYSMPTTTSAVPVVGMLCGSSISAIVIAVNYVLKELQWVSCHH